MTAKNGLGGRTVGLGEEDQPRTPTFAERKEWGTVGGFWVLYFDGWQVAVGRDFAGWVGETRPLALALRSWLPGKKEILRRCAPLDDGQKRLGGRAEG